MAEQQYDLIIAGSGAAGLAAAIYAQANGLKAVVLEKTDRIGGTTAYSGGVAWVPNSTHNERKGVADSFEESLRYLENTVPSPHEQEARQSYLKHAPKAFEVLEGITGPLYYVRDSNSPDYYPDAGGALREGRALTPLSFDGRLLGEHFHDLRPPLPELSLFGRQMLELADVYHLLNAKRSIGSAAHALRLGSTYVRDRIFYRRFGRGVRLTGGNALLARLYQTALAKQIPVLRNTALVDLTGDETGITGAIVEHAGSRERWQARLGVVLATGGFPWSQDLRQRKDAATPFGYSAACEESATGDGITIAMAHSAALDSANEEPAFWSPVSVFNRADGSKARFPHLMADRAKPGLIAIDANGERFCNEAENYHDFVRAMRQKNVGAEGSPAYLICDSTFVRKYPFGAVPPLGSERRRFIKLGYLVEASSIEDLAAQLNVDATQLRSTLERYNRDAAEGVDTQFGKGASAYNRYLGDLHHKPNPCLAPIVKPPYYALRIYAGDIGTAAGLATDVNARVLDHDRAPIGGLYAAGNDRNSIMAGYYPSGGITIGPALTFAYLAVQHAAGKLSCDDKSHA